MRVRDAFADVDCNVTGSSSVSKLKIIFANFTIGIYSIEGRSEVLLHEFDYADYDSYRYTSRDNSQKVTFTLYFATSNPGYKPIFDLDVDVPSRSGSLMVDEVNNQIQYSLTNCIGGIQ